MLFFVERAVAWIMMCRYRDGILTSVLGPTAELLSFAPPKESSQRKGGPDAAFILRSRAFAEGCRKGHPWPFGNASHPCAAPIGLFSANAPVLGAAYGINTVTNFKGRPQSFGVSMNMELI